MKSLPLTPQERAYIEAHKDDAERALRGLIHDVRLTRRHLAAHLSAFQRIAQSLSEAVREGEGEKMREHIADALSIAENFSIPLATSYQEIMKAMLFDPMDVPSRPRTRKRAKVVV